MDAALVYFSSYELVLSVVFGLLTVFIATRFINLLLFKFDKTELANRNLSTSIFTGGMIVCAMILVQSSVLPSVDALRTMVLSQERLNAEIIAISLAYFLAFYTLSIIISMLVIFASIRIHMAATLDVDEIAEIKADNVAQSVLLTAVLVGVTLFIQEPFGRFISSLVDYDQLEAVRVDMPPAPMTDEELVVPQRKVSPN